MNWFKKLSQTSYGYRGVDNPEEIKRKGLIPNWHFKSYQFEYDKNPDYKLLNKQQRQSPWMFIAKDFQGANQYGSVTLRFLLPSDVILSPGNPNYLISKQTIPPNLIEFDKGSMSGSYYQEWLPLSQFK